MQQPVRYQYIRGRHDAVVPHGLSEHFATERHVRRLAFAPAGTAGRRGPSRPRRRAGPRPTMRRDTPARHFRAARRPARPASGSDAAGPTPQASARAIVGERRPISCGGFSISRIRNTNRGKLSCVSALIYSKKFLSCLKFSLPDKRLLMRSFSAGKQR